MLHTVLGNATVSNLLDFAKMLEQLLLLTALGCDCAIVEGEDMLDINLAKLTKLSMVRKILGVQQPCSYPPPHPPNPCTMCQALLSTNATTHPEESESPERMLGSGLQPHTCPIKIFQHMHCNTRTPKHKGDNMHCNTRTPKHKGGNLCFVTRMRKPITA